MTGVHQVPPPGAGAPPGSGPLRLAATGDADQTGLDAFARAMTVNCPFLRPSLRRDLVRWHRYEAEPGAARETVEAGLFAVGVWAAEQVRARRRDLGVGVCEVVAVDQAAAGIHGPWSVLQWPHWTLKQLYAPVGVMFGKFAPGETRTDRRSRAVAAPPVAILAVRPALPTVDPGLLPNTPALAQMIATSADDGRDVFHGVPGVRHAADPWPAVRAWSDQR